MKVKKIAVEHGKMLIIALKISLKAQLKFTSNSKFAEGKIYNIRLKVLKRFRFINVKKIAAERQKKL